MASAYDPNDYSGSAPTSGGATAVSAILGGAKSIKDALTKRKSGDKSDRPSGSKGPATSANPEPPPEDYRMAIPSTLKRGGKVRKTGYALVHKGERMLTASQTKKKRKRARGVRR